MYRYILRYCIMPDFHENDRIAELVEFCRSSRIEEVMLFYNAEESFQGYPDETVRQRWLVMAKKIKSALADAGVEMSVNPWTTVTHGDRGRRPPEKLKNMRLQVGETGLTMPIAACPFCGIWRKELADWFARIAVEVEPVAIWVEDDWRLHNHGGEHGYGGCFCSEHLRLTAEKLGLENLTREELLAKIAADDKRYRNAWIDVCGESLDGAAEYLGEVVRNAAPQVKLAFMYGRPDIHSIEGRSWERYKQAFSPHEPMLIRPNLSPYTEISAMQAQPEMTRHGVIQYEPEEVVIYPELESSPRNGQYTKSGTFAMWQCAASIPYGARGITINHYDMMGNGIVLDEKFGKYLRRDKERLNTLAQLGCLEVNASGVDVLTASEVARTMPVRKGEWLGLQNNSISWAYALGILGISHRIIKIDRFAPEHWTAVSGDTLTAFSDAEIERLLTGHLLLDADSVNILVKRGFGTHIGVAAAEFRKLGDVGYAYEEILSDDAKLYGLSRPRITAQRIAPDVLQMTLTGQPEVLCRICRFDHTELYPGLARCGRHLLSAWRMEKGQFFMGYFNRFRRIMLQQVLSSGGSAPLLCGGDFPWNVSLNCLPDGSMLATIGNPMHDAAEQVSFKLYNREFTSMEILDADGRWQTVNPERNAAGEYVINYSQKALETIFVRLK